MARSPDTIPLALEECLFHHGLALFNARRFFEAHETWEHIWRRLPPCPKRNFYHGLIQIAVALEHYRRGNPAGARSLHRTYPHYFAELPPTFMGLHLPTLLAAMEHTLAPILTPATDVPPADSPAPARLDLTTAPTLTLHHDPFVTDEPIALNHS